MQGLTVGRVARLAQVNAQTVLYYERCGLLPRASRTAANYRVYAEEAVRRVRFVRRAQGLGFTLKEIKELLSLRAEPDTRCADVRKQASAKLRDIEQKMRALRNMRRALTKLLAECSGKKSATECPILEALDSEAKRR